MHRLQTFICVVFGLLALPTPVFAATVIAHPDCAVDTISDDDLQKMFLGKKKTWDAGAKVILVIPNDNDDFGDFLKHRIGKSESQFKSYWKKMVFTGKGAMPIDLDSDAEIQAFVAANPGALGIVSGAAGDGVTTIAIQ